MLVVPQKFTTEESTPSRRDESLQNFMESPSLLSKDTELDVRKEQIMVEPKRFVFFVGCYSYLPLKRDH